MSANMTETFNPFARHMSPNRSSDHKTAEAAGIAQKTEAETGKNSSVSFKPVEEKSSRAARTGKSFDPFSRHTGEKKLRSQPRARRAQEPPPVQKLITWLQHWSKPTVSVRDIVLYGPNSLRDPKIAIEVAEILVNYRWLIPVKTRRRDMKWWQIVRGRSEDPIAATPTVAQL